MNEYRKNHDVVTSALPVPNSGKKEPKKHTHTISLELWQEYKNIAKVAEERGMVISTIERHLAQLISKGELPVSDFVSDKKLKELSSFFKKKGSVLLSEAKTELGDKYTYSELRFVRHHIIYLESSKDNKIPEN